MAAIIKPIAPETVQISGTPMIRYSGNVPEKGQPYKMLAQDRAAFAGLTESAFHLSGMVSRSSDKAAPVAMDGTKHGGFSLWRAIVGSTAAGHWIKTGRVDPATGKITVAGLNELSSRTNGTSRGYNTTPEKIREMAEAIRTGGTAMVAGKPLKFGASLSIAKAKPKAAAKSTSKASSTAKKVDLTPKSK